MRYPSKKKLSEIDKSLRNQKSSEALSKNASYVDRLKYELCKQIIKYLRKNRISQTDLAYELELDPARVSEIVNYKISKYTIDSLLAYNRKLNPKFELKIKQAG